MKYFKFIFIFIFILESLLFSESFIIKHKKAHSFKEFLLYYKKVNNLNINNFSGKPIPNRIHKFHFLINKNLHTVLYKNSFSETGDPLLSEQDWLKAVDGLELINMSKGDGIVIGLLDSGVEMEHEDLKGQFLKYYNVAEDSYDVSDGFGHGTSVAGIIGAIANNGIGIRGVAPDVKFVVAKINIGASPTFDDYSVAKGIYYLVDNGAKIINMSIQMDQSNEVIDDAINYAEEKGVILVAASGNAGEDEESYPARNSYVLGIGSVNNDFEKSSFSNYDDNLFIMAPGEQILTTYIGNNYARQNGTSFSAPIISGIIADMLSLNPYYSLNDIKKILLHNAYNDSSLQFKVVDMDNAILGTGVQFVTKNEFHYGETFQLSMTLPPFSNSFDFYFGFIMPDGQVAILQYKDHYYYDVFYSDSLPTCSLSPIDDYMQVDVYGGDNAVLSTLTFEEDLQSGTYEACAVYSKNNKSLGYVQCKKFNLLQ
jgi:hypothetical protein